MSRKSAFESDQNTGRMPSTAWSHVPATKYHSLLERNQALARENSKLKLKVRQLERELAEERDHQVDGTIEAQRIRETASIQLRKVINEGAVVRSMVDNMLISLNGAFNSLEDQNDFDNRGSGSARHTMSIEDREHHRRSSIDKLHDTYQRFGLLNLSSITEASERPSMHVRLSLLAASEALSNLANGQPHDFNRESIVTSTSLPVLAESHPVPESATKPKTAYGLRKRQSIHGGVDCSDEDEAAPKSVLKEVQTKPLPKKTSKTSTGKENEPAKKVRAITKPRTTKKKENQMEVSHESSAETKQTISKRAKVEPVKKSASEEIKVAEKKSKTVTKKEAVIVPSTRPLTRSRTKSQNSAKETDLE